ncbi:MULTISPECIES: STAS domain-containing protein [unclassified Bacillus (in: firmicutes)]|uniref:STAS domain-containing protein n=1 Tax=unclassified Bacillus (in: firmicutes) TaxID=185979 RepID=UPI001BE7928F|nr:MULTISPECIES: STAS domain-containing protein [unclassified Bacillus (in: firmicutes)]MBT2637660.1 STAS domain-containing protein [Bacillus sp. ISL-39]MBT2662044.1 STAS domain-containing protein [Bacillus sp. ISL-45]
MTTELQALGEAIVSRKHEIAKSVHKDRYSEAVLTEAQKYDLGKIEQQILEIRANFIEIFGQALIDHEDQEKAFDKITDWGKETGEYIYKLGASLDEALKDTSYYREHIWRAIKEEAKDMSASAIFGVLDIIDPLMDHAIYSFSLTFVDAHQKSLENAKTALLELSVPVVPLMPGVGVLPLVGNVDTERAQLLMEETLDQAVKLKLTHLIFDVSGVMIVDTMVADQLFKVINALSLVGVKTIMTGIRPEVAHTMVTLGLNLEGIMVKSNLHQAFKEIQTL